MSAYLQWVDARGDTVGLDIDAAKVVTYERAAEVTEHPVERGSPVADHIRTVNGAFTLEGIISDTPVRIPRTHTRGLTRTARNVDLVVEGQPVRVQLQQWTGALDRRRACHEALTELVTARRVVTLTTRLETIENLAVTRVQVTEDEESGNALKLSLGFTQLRIAGTARATVPALPRNQVRAQRGAQPPDDRSASARGLDGGNAQTPEQRAAARERLRIRAMDGRAGQ